MATPAIKVEALGKRYRLTHGQERARYRTLRESLVDAVKAPFRKRGTTEEFWALSDVSFEVQPGEVVGIIGRNGAGKSTLLKILSRITKPTRGRVEINGRVGSLLEVGTGFHAELTGRENIFLNGAILGMSRREIAIKFDEIVAFAEVEKFLDTPVKRYSSGMYVRLAFAVAAHLEPEILIVDEVLAVGDAGFQQKCLGKIEDVSRSGRTVLIVSHQLNTVRQLCKQAVWLDAGRRKRFGPATKLIEDYLAEAASRPRAAVWLDLTRVSRRGSGEARVAGTRFVGDSEDTPPVSDGRLAVTVKVVCDQNRTDTHAAMQIYDRFGSRLIDVNTIHHGGPPLLRAGATELTFVIDRLHLSPGAYRVGFELGTLTEHYDEIIDAFTLDVLPGSETESELLAHAGLVTR
ncbi:MAG: ABC transporter ATP-binding protein [Gemmataceae bacterium]